MHVYGPPTHQPSYHQPSYIQASPFFIVPEPCLQLKLQNVAQYGSLKCAQTKLQFNSFASAQVKPQTNDQVNLPSCFQVFPETFKHVNALVYPEVSSESFSQGGFSPYSHGIKDSTTVDETSSEASDFTSRKKIKSNSSKAKKVKEPELAVSTSDDFNLEKSKKRKRKVNTSQNQRPNEASKKIRRNDHGNTGKSFVRKFLRHLDDVGIHKMIRCPGLPLFVKTLISQASSRKSEAEGGKNSTEWRDLLSSNDNTIRLEALDKLLEDSGIELQSKPTIQAQLPPQYQEGIMLSTEAHLSLLPLKNFKYLEFEFETNTNTEFEMDHAFAPYQNDTGAENETIFRPMNNGSWQMNELINTFNFDDTTGVLMSTLTREKMLEKLDELVFREIANYLRHEETIKQMEDEYMKRKFAKNEGKEEKIGKIMEEILWWREEILHLTDEGNSRLEERVRAFFDEKEEKKAIKEKKKEGKKKENQKRESKEKKSHK